MAEIPKMLSKHNLPSKDTSKVKLLFVKYSRMTFSRVKVHYFQTGSCKVLYSNTKVGVYSFILVEV